MHSLAKLQAVSVYHRANTEVRLARWTEHFHLTRWSLHGWCEARCALEGLRLTHIVPRDPGYADPSPLEQANHFYWWGLDTLGLVEELPETLEELPPLLRPVATETQGAPDA